MRTEIKPCPICKRDRASVTPISKICYDAKPDMTLSTFVKCRKCFWEGPRAKETFGLMDLIRNGSVEKLYSLVEESAIKKWNLEATKNENPS